jgi:hypothetical protein
MNPELKRMLARPARPVLARFDAIILRLDSIDARLSRLETRVEEMEEFVQATATRVSTVVERSNAGEESAVRIRRRLSEIESLLGAAAKET